MSPELHCNPHNLPQKEIHSHTHTTFNSVNHFNPLLTSEQNDALDDLSPTVTDSFNVTHNANALWKHNVHSNNKIKE